MRSARQRIKDGSLGSCLGRASSVLTACMVMLAASTASADDDTLVAREEAALQAAAERVAASVVQIRTIGGLDTVEGTVLADGPTTGLIVSPDGYIVSSAFNFVQQPASILVTFASGKQAPAELVAKDHSRMIVMLKASGVEDLSAPEFTPADEIRVGQWALAVGRTYRADRTNVSVGIVSAVGRMFGKVLQTDADTSTANYGGPLVDVQGRVLGVIVPMAPQGASEVAGAEWYDSGIGFAVPLAEIVDRLAKLKAGEDQRAGILGIGLEARNPHSAPAKLAAVRPDGPAGKAGLKKGDRIVELDGRPIRTQTDLRFVLGPRYAEDRVKLVVERDKERIERTITLAGKLPVFRHAFLGILPLRPATATAAPAAASDVAANGEPDDDDTNADDKPTDDGSDNKNDEGNVDDPDSQSGVTVRFVYNGSPADEAGIQIGDVVVQINKQAVESIDEAIAVMNNAVPGSEISLRLQRGGNQIDLTLTAARMPTTVPAKLPAADRDADGEAASAAGPDGQAKPGETRELKLPEFPQDCTIYVPASHAADRPQGVLMYLRASGKADADDLIRQWQPICDRDGLLLIVPTPGEADRWDPTELEYLGRLTERVVRQYKVDPRRVVVCGEQSGGAMAWLLSLAGREVFRGVVVSAAPLPRQVRVPENEPTERLAVFASIPTDRETAVPIAQGLQKVSEAGYSVTTVTPADAADQWTDTEREELARWIDTLDRF